MFGLGNRWANRHGAAGGDLEKRVAALEAAVQENRALNVRLAELTDVVTELLLPVAARDEERLEELLGKYRGDFS
ncbi:DUF6752 domain-containing protein [Nocardioides ganghwensis]|jgi:hypothetical protein|uniref:DUF6752 domain-containing protein n=1 Tax=Nocardioides ganghwensis TaxID=252230 RepID=A0A4Q2SBS1_9ACTN|nr:DUF6752 domain-containing protein [Nocardioides ganghwensis]MBD3945795.1 hypothetical protein [Nocardioides ganghwensis]RYC01190.1 hypothetical protein EUA07_12480 [Nocardioides ganghwensis]